MVHRVWSSEKWQTTERNKKHSKIFETIQLGKVQICLRKIIEVAYSQKGDNFVKK